MNFLLGVEAGAVLGRLRPPPHPPPPVLSPYRLHITERQSADLEARATGSGQRAAARIGWSGFGSGEWGVGALPPSPRGVIASRRVAYVMSVGVRCVGVLWTLRVCRRG